MPQIILHCLQSIMRWGYWLPRHDRWDILYKLYLSRHAQMSSTNHLCSSFSGLWYILWLFGERWWIKLYRMPSQMYVYKPCYIMHKGISPEKCPARQKCDTERFWHSKNRKNSDEYGNLHEKELHWTNIKSGFSRLNKKNRWKHLLWKYIWTSTEQVFEWMVYITTHFPLHYFPCWGLIMTIINSNGKSDLGKLLQYYFYLEWVLSSHAIPGCRV